MPHYNGESKTEIKRKFNKHKEQQRLLSSQPQILENSHLTKNAIITPRANHPSTDQQPMELLQPDSQYHNKKREFRCRWNSYQQNNVLTNTSSRNTGIGGEIHLPTCDISEHKTFPGSGASHGDRDSIHTSKTHKPQQVSLASLSKSAMCIYKYTSNQIKNRQ